MLLRKDVKAAKDAVMDRAVGHAITFADGTKGNLYVAPSIAVPPKWVRFFSGNPVATALSKLRTLSAGALLIVPVGRRLVAAAFGPGRFLVKPGLAEDDFGLKVTLNSIPVDQVKSIDRKTFAAFTTHTRTQGSRAGTCEDYGVDIEQDLLRAVVGTPSDSALGVNMSGSDSLSVGAKVDLDGLPALLTKYVKQFKSNAYKANFSWVDHIREERDRAQIDSLDEQLVQKLRASDLDRVWLAVPDVIDWSRVAGFRYGRGRKAKTFPDTRMVDLLPTIRNLPAISVRYLKARQVFCVSAEDEGQLYDTWTLYQCLYAELDVARSTYLLSGGRWYRIAKDFVDEVNADIAKLVVQTSLPGYDSSTFPRDEDYLRDVASTDTSFALMDQRFIHHGGGGSKFELCDLLGQDRRLVHVKRYAGSATLSHLFNQGEGTATLLVQDPEFRKKAIAKVPASHRALIPQANFRARQFTVLFAITSKSSKSIDSSLPFFSRLALRRTARILRGHGYKVQLTKIDDITP
ncbi:MAG: TIGR04141 family sporadically distributed protein [Kofleriaceae bacterium]